MRIRTHGKNYAPKSEVFKRDYPLFGLGDIVHAVMHPHFHSDGSPLFEHIGRVIEISYEQSYGLTSELKKQPPLVTILLADRTEQTFCASLITEVEKAKVVIGIIGKPKNIFAEGLKRDPQLQQRCSVSTTHRILSKGTVYKVTICKGVLCGPLTELATLVLARMNTSLERYIDREKLYSLYKKQGMPGMVEEIHRGIYTVNKKAFKKWIKRNALAICYTVAQMRAMQTTIAIDSEESAMRDLDNEAEHNRLFGHPSIEEALDDLEDLSNDRGDISDQDAADQEMDFLLNID
jgi:hypothetical protein